MSGRREVVGREAGRLRRMAYKRSDCRWEKREKKKERLIRMSGVEDHQLPDRFPPTTLEKARINDSPNKTPTSSPSPSPSC